MTSEALDIRHVFRDGQPRDLLVLTDAQRSGRNALALPFQDATVIEADTAEQINVEGRFDAIVIDRCCYDPQWLDSTADKLLAALRPGGRVIVTMQPTPDAFQVNKSATLTGLAWQGLASLNGQPCAVLYADDQGTAHAGPFLHTARIAIQLATSGESSAAIARYVESRGRSERALLLHLRALAEELARERWQHRGVALVRTVLYRSKAGRGILRVLRPYWRTARRLWAAARRGVLGSSRGNRLHPQSGNLR